jgi:Mitochondrial carrier protein
VIATSFGVTLAPPPADALHLVPTPINAYAARRQEIAYQSYMQHLEARFETVADLRSVVKAGGGGLGVSYRVSGIAAFIASAMSTAIVHPLDTLKTRIQARSFSAANAVVPLDLTNLYRGIESNILKEAPNAAIYLYTYELLKTFLLSTSTFHDLPLLVFMIAGALGDAFGSIVRVPAEVVNKRLQLGVNSDWQSACRDAFLSAEGRQSTLLTWQAVLWRDVPYGGIQIALYEVGKQYLLSHPGQFGSFLAPGVFSDVFTGAVAGAIAAILTTPADVLVTKLSIQNPQSYLETRRYMGVVSTASRIVRDEGFLSLFSGYLQRGIYYAPLIGLFFALFESARTAVNDPSTVMANAVALQSQVGGVLHHAAFIVIGSFASFASVTS